MDRLLSEPSHVKMPFMEMILTDQATAENWRFETLLRGTAPESAANHDRPLMIRPNWLLAPTLGAIVPNWLLLIPREPILNFRIWAESHTQSPEDLVSDVLRHLGLGKDEIIWFEHGPRVVGTVVGCGMDHAHLHILVRPPFRFDAFAEKARSLSRLEWIADNSEGAYCKLADDRSYLIAGSADQAIMAHNAEAAGSQFFRRVVGSLVDAGDTWDYRRHPHIDHISETISTFRSLESAAQRGK